MISISCLDSKLLNNNNWYGRFQLAPFGKGEGLTIANALRRTLLAEKSKFHITWVDFYNAEIPYSVLTGMRESIFDILLNLKQVVFTSDVIIPKKQLGEPHRRALEFRAGRAFKNFPLHNFKNTESHRAPYKTYNAKGSNVGNLLFKLGVRPFYHQDFNKMFLMSDPLQTTLKKTQPMVRYQIQKDSSYNHGSNLYGTHTTTKPSYYVGYICVKGPAIIYAKNLKLPKGLKCIDPEKYIVTLADDGLFYLRLCGLVGCIYVKKL